MGSACLRYLAREGHDVLAVDNLTEGHAAALNGVLLEIADISDTERIVAILVELRTDAVMHFAAYTYFGVSVTDPAVYYKNNVTGSLSLLQAMRRAGV